MTPIFADFATRGMRMTFGLARDGSKDEAEEIKRAISNFLRDTLRLELSLRENAHYTCS